MNARKRLCNQGLESGRIRSVAIGRLIWILILASIVTFVLFEVNFVFEFDENKMNEMPDPASEQAFDRCYLLKDDEIHATAFGTIDNPDVQKEFISSNREIARRECREQHPRVMVPADQKSGFNLIDLQPRFW